MGFIRGGLLVIIAVLLFISILLANLFFTISWSLNYNTVQPELKNVVNGLVEKTVGNPLEGDFSKMQTYCKSKKVSNYSISFEGSALTIPCSVVNQSKEAVFDYGVDQFISQVYYKNYECNFFDCFDKQEIPFFVVSAKTQNYFYSKFNLTLMFIGILLILGFVLAEKKGNFFLLISILVIIAALPFAKFDLLFGLFGSTAESLLLVFFSKAYYVFLSGIVIGVTLLLIAVMIKLFKVGWKISGLFARKDDDSNEKVSKDEVTDIVKKELRESKDRKKSKKKN